MKQLFELGSMADKKLAAQGLIVTQGGEPTFIPHDSSKLEWITAALGDEKLMFARRLARNLVDLYLPGAVVLQSFGKQYPGEPLPRWRIGLYRPRTAPLWSDLSRIRLDENRSPVVDVELPQRFLQGLATELQIANTTLPAYENFYERVRLAEQTPQAFPVPHFSREARRFESFIPKDEALKPWEHLLQPAGYVLPLEVDGDKWRTSAWKVLTGKEFTLLLGDSPIGLRLSLGLLSEDSLRTALTAEVKNGEFVVFLPPLPSFEAFCRLVRAIERVAAKLSLPPMAFEGYPPPDAAECDSICLTADPGVIEVNLPPAADWPAFERIVGKVFAAAEQSGLRGHKFHYSGRKISTGGGAHIILGGPTLSENPFFKRPGLLSSFLRFIQNHPSLSYIFTGLFIGPSSQAPRVDESAYEIPYELEISLRSLEKMKSPGEPPLMDAILRNLLLDCNGNTHRAEVSVDKFFNPSATNGRLGLVEFRAFEMMPTADLFLSMNLLLRALAASFAERPYERPLIHWREALHDKFALPHFLAQDLGEVLGYLRGDGFEFPPGCFQPHLDFRFPVVWEWDAGDARWQLRQALEPWPVMGETASARTVDASTDRLQLSVAGPAAVHLAAIVNGIRIPLLAQSGSLALGAIRYRLFDNAAGLQPQVKAHSPLSFEIVDLASMKIVHAFDYMNWRRDGGGYEGMPASEAEAQQRVAERLIAHPERLGMATKFCEIALSPEAPFTLDLRMQDIKTSVSPVAA